MEEDVVKWITKQEHLNNQIKQLNDKYQFLSRETSEKTVRHLKKVDELKL